MRCLVLLNGAPGVGKSTVADGLADARPDTAALDVDTVKHGLPAWPDDPRRAGLQARAVVLRRAMGLLRGGSDVVIGQYLARPDFIDQLSSLARAEGVRFIEVVLQVDAATLARRLEDRCWTPDRLEHRVNNARVGPNDAARLIRSLEALLVERTDARLVTASGSVEETVGAVRVVITQILGHAPPR